MPYYKIKLLYLHLHFNPLLTEFNGLNMGRRYAAYCAGLGFGFGFGFGAGMRTSNL